jgi:hypothetical protein
MKKLIQNLTDYHFAYQDLYRHWHAESERYTGGDALNTALDEGWIIKEIVGLQEVNHIGARGTVVYHFELSRKDETVTMPVVGNPYVDRLVMLMQFKLVPLAKAS